MKKIVFLVFLALLVLPFALADCSFSTKDAKEFHLFFNVRSDFISDVEMRFVVPFSQSCLQELGVATNPFECSEALLPANDGFFRSLGFFSNKSTCFGTYSDGALAIDFTTQTDMLANQLANNNVEITFREWAVTDSNDESSLKNTLTIKVPQGAKLTAFYPMSDPKGVADYANGVVVWDPIPSSAKKPSVKFSLQDNSWMFFVGIVVLLIIIGGIGFFLMKRQKSNAIIDQIKALKAKTLILEQDFMKGKMDETTYRRLMEQYQLQMNDLKAQLSKANGIKEKIPLDKLKL